MKYVKCRKMRLLALNFFWVSVALIMVSSCAITNNKTQKDVNAFTSSNNMVSNNKMKTRINASNETNFPPIKESFLSSSAMSWVICNTGEIMLSTDAGQSWYPLVIKLGEVDTIHFLNKKTGWLVNSKGEVWRTEDGGQNWLNISTLKPGTESDWEYTSTLQVNFSNEKQGWLIEAFSVWRTEDGGSNWKRILDSSTANWKGQPTKGTFLSTPKAFITTTEAEIYITDNRGINWRMIHLGKSVTIEDIYFINERVGWLSGYSNSQDGGIFFRTNNGGISWKQYGQIDSNIYIDSIQFLNINEGWIAGGKTISESDFQAVLLHTLDGGETWNEINIGKDEKYFHKIYFESSENGWCVSDDKVYRIRNGKLSIIFDTFKL